MRLSKLNILINVLLALFIGAVAMTTFGMNPYLVAAGVASAGCFYTVAQKGKAMPRLFMGLQVEMWKSTIEQEIRKDNSFLFNADVVDKENILNGKVVHIPQSGGSGEIIKNPNSFPLPIRERADTDVVYVLDYYATKPVRIPYLDTKELSYDKRVSVLGEDLDALKESVADQMLYNWVTSPAYGSYSASALPSGMILTVSGDNGASNADAEAGTGNRKKASLDDMQRMSTLFKSKNVKRWKENEMYCMLTPNMLAEIAPANSQITAQYMQSVTEQERREGVYMKIQGWKIMNRSSVLSTTADGSAIRTPDEAGASTDQGASLFWYKRTLESALGEIAAFERLRDPEFHGDIYSFGMRFGGRCKREDYKGVALLRQAATT